MKMVPPEMAFLASLVASRTLSPSETALTVEAPEEGAAESSSSQDTSGLT